MPLSSAALNDFALKDFAGAVGICESHKSLGKDRLHSVMAAEMKIPRWLHPRKKWLSAAPLYISSC